MEQIEYVEVLRENCCSAFAGIVQALAKSEQEMMLLYPHIPIMFQLIVQIVNSQPPAEDILNSSACALVGDLLRSFGTSVLELVENEPIHQLLQKCRRSRNNRARSVANWVSLEIARVRRLANQA